VPRAGASAPTSSPPRCALSRLRSLALALVPCSASTAGTAGVPVAIYSVVVSIPTRAQAALLTVLCRPPTHPRPAAFMMATMATLSQVASFAVPMAQVIVTLALEGSCGGGGGGEGAQEEQELLHDLQDAVHHSNLGEELHARWQRG
jgi:hypothetical protein